MTRVRFDPSIGHRPAGIPEESVVTVLRVPPESAGMRLDVFVQGQLKRTSRTRAQAIIKKGAYDANARPLRANDRVSAEQQVHLWREPWDEVAVPTDLPVLFEDEHFIAIAKPANVPVHPTARYHRNTVVKLLEQERPGERLRLSHRLDRETSGVLLLAKHAGADRGIKRLFEARDTVEKEYVAITWGAPERDEFSVELPLELDPNSRVKVAMRVAASGSGLSARTHFEVLDRRRSTDGRSYAMLRCLLETGRQHQIRVHLAALGFAIVGDKLYGPDAALFTRGVDGALDDADRAKLELGRHALHAARLSFAHPITGATIVIEAPLAADLAAFWSQLAPTG